MAEEKTASVSYSQIPAIIKMIEEKVKLIPQDQVVAIQVIQMLLSLVNSYAFWTTGLKQELQKLDKLNKSQAEMIHNKGIIV